MGTPLFFLGACLGTLVWHDWKSRRRIEPGTIWGAAVTVATIILTPVLAFSYGMDVVHWLARVTPQ
jgi:hypothetical protein